MGDLHRSASLSPDGRYRWDLQRWWDTRPPLAFVMLNPSTADADVDDQTVRMCRHFAERDGYGGIVVRNLYAFRSPKPAQLWSARRVGIDVIGSHNDDWLSELRSRRLDTVAAWGTHPRAASRVATVVERLGIDWLCLGRNVDGSPFHPCRLSKSAELRPWTPS